MIIVCVEYILCYLCYMFFFIENRNFESKLYAGVGVGGGGVKFFKYIKELLDIFSFFNYL